MPTHTLIQNIKTLREKENLTYVQLERRLGLSGNTIVSRWERGILYPQTYHLALLSFFFNISIDDLCRKILK